jgi:hypothetical protein
MDRYLEMLDAEPTTRRAYVGYIDKHIRPNLLVDRAAIISVGSERPVQRSRI